MFNIIMKCLLRWSFWAILAFGPVALAQDIGCTACHREYTSGSVHAALDQDCATCHGDGSEHITRPIAGISDIDLERDFQQLVTGGTRQDLFSIAYRNVDYKEDLEDYDADIVEIAFGLRW